MAEGEIPEGFRKTEAGVIPKGWEVRSLGTLGSWKGGMTPSMSNSSFWKNGNIPWISSGDVKSSIIRETASRVTKKSITEGRTTLLPKHSVIVVMRSGILRKFLPVAITSDPMAINQDIKALLPASGISPYFVLHLILHFGDRILAECLKTGTTVESIEYPWLKKFPIPFPLFDEQCAIATVLSDVDALIAGLDQLIAKKRTFKQAALQQLLTGQKRLPGFRGEWSETILGDISEVKTGPFGSSLHEKDYVKVGTPIITVEHLGEFGVEHVNLPMVSDRDRRRLDAYSLRIGDIVFSRVGSIDRNAMIRPAEEGWLFSGRLLRVRPDVDKVFAAFLSYQFHSERFIASVRAIAVGQTMASINTQILNCIPIKLPCLEEQVAIATILSDMDSEITALEQRRDKTRLLKRGMMQELLTGRIRLVDPAAPPSSQLVKPRTKSLATG